MAFMDTLKQSPAGYAYNKLTKKASSGAMKFPVTSARAKEVLFGPNAQASGRLEYATPATPMQAPGYKSSGVTTPAPKVNTNLNLGTGGAGGSGVQGFDMNGNETEDQLAFLRDKQTKAINKNYDIEVGSLKDMEKRARSAYGDASAQVQAYYPEFQRLVGEQQASTEGQIAGLENTRKYESERALGQARQLLNDLQRRQYAQMSATGNYGSSVPEAFASQFADKAYNAQNQIQTSRDQSLNELASKRVEAKQYFDTKLFEGKQKYDTMMQSLQQQLNSQLDQISNAKSQSAQAKNSASLEAWNNYVNNKFSLDQELRNYNQSLMQYATQTENDGANPFENTTASDIDSSNNANILPADQGVGSQVNLNQHTAMNTPIYTKRKVTNPDDPFASGFQLNNTWA